MVTTNMVMKPNDGRTRFIVTNMGGLGSLLVPKKVMQEINGFTPKPILVHEIKLYISAISDVN
jgi:hypothetical protein